MVIQSARCNLPSSELATINVLTVDFLSWLREKDAVAADQRFAVMMNTAARSTRTLRRPARSRCFLVSYLHRDSPVVFHGGAGCPVQ